MTKLTYAKNVLIPLTTACNNQCSYCNFREPVKQAKIMNLAEIKILLKQAKRAGCKEALFILGSQPDKRSGFRTRLQEKTGFSSIYQLLIAACKLALEIGLLPHSNPGVVDRKLLSQLAPYNASMGLMLETTAQVAAHSKSPTKDPTRRLDFIAQAGKLKIPFTTGLLLGIGENRQDRRESLEVLQELHIRYGHLQEIIVQPVKTEQTNTSISLVKQTLKQANQIMSDEVAIQVPPNLVDITQLVSLGVQDLGGISPLSADHINPDYNWPQVNRLQEKLAPISLQERLPVYSGYLTSRWLEQPVQECLQREGWLDEYQ